MAQDVANKVERSSHENIRGAFESVDVRERIRN